MANEKWIQNAISSPGSLRKALKVKKGETIPTKELKKAELKGGKIAKRAQLAETLKSFHKK